MGRELTESLQIYEAIKIFDTLNITFCQSVFSYVGEKRITIG